MQAKQLIAVSALAFLGTAAFAQEATPDTWTNVAATSSRAEVRAQVQQADLAVVRAGEATLFADSPVSVKSRAEVRAEALANGRRFTPDVYNVGA